MPAKLTKQKTAEEDHSVHADSGLYERQYCYILLVARPAVLKGEQNNDRFVALSFIPCFSTCSLFKDVLGFQTADAF